MTPKATSDEALQAALDELEASDPAVKAAGDKLRDTERWLRGDHSRLGIKLASYRRQRLARLRWRTAALPPSPVQNEESNP